jgi:hypothetical protein
VSTRRELFSKLGGDNTTAAICWITRDTDFQSSTT